jgi:hypothetical protein
LNLNSYLALVEMQSAELYRLGEPVMSRRVFGAPARLYLGDGVFAELGAIVVAIGRKPGIGNGR